MEHVNLTDGRVRLTVHTEQDIEGLAAALQDPSVLRWMPAMPDPYTEDSADFFINQIALPNWEKDTEYSWALRQVPEGWQEGDEEPPIVGGLGIIPLPRCHSSVEIGWWLNSEHRGQGLVSAAARLALGWAFSPDGLGVNRAIWKAELGNWPSRRVAWSIGFRVEGKLRSELVNRAGAPSDAWIGTLLADDPRKPNEPWPAEGK